MAKDKKSEKVVVSKKGCVINRKHNRTINQDVCHRDPKWEDVGSGVLKLKGSTHNYIKRGQDNKWESVKKPAQQATVEQKAA
jgi:hypothetical protein